MINLTPDALLPCPFCGNGDAPFVINDDQAWVECGDCTTRVVVGPFDTDAEAIAAWNRRAGQSHAGLLEAAERLITGVRERYPGEDLQCPDMIALDAAIAAAKGA